MEPGLRGPGRDVEDLGRLGERQVEVEVEDHHGSLVDRKSTQLASEPVALGDGQGEVEFGRRLSVGHHVQLDHGPALSWSAPTGNRHGR